MVTFLFMKKKLIIWGVVLFLLIAGGFTTFTYFKNNNEHFQTFLDFPDSVRQIAIVTEVKRPLALVFPALMNDQEINTRHLKSSIRMGAQWIVNMQEPSGRFNYWYNPDQHTFSNQWDDNFLRQAGTAYALAVAGDLFNDTAYIQSATKSVAYLNSFLGYLEDDKAYYLYRKKAKLGGIALPMLAMMALKEATNDSTWDDLLLKLGNMIIYQQESYGTGQFKSTYTYLGKKNYEEKSGWESKIYPGEALLALAELYYHFEDKRYLKAFDRAVDFYNGTSFWRSKSFWPWTASALARMSVYAENEKFANLAYDIADRTTYWQNADEEIYHFGGFFGVSSVFSSTFLEGIGDVYQMAVTRGDSSYIIDLENRLFAGYHFLHQLQIDSTDLKENNYKEIALGGFKTLHSDPQIRIDNTQHAISSMTKYFIRIKEK